MTHLQSIGGDVEDALESISVPSYVIDRTGIVRWLNPAARRLVGDARGRQFTSVCAPEDTRRSREVFARNLARGTGSTDAPLVVIGADGKRIAVEISSAPLRQDHRVIGMFGQATDVKVSAPRMHPQLTPRQAEVLALLERGHSTDGIARELHLSVETVRNHIRHILRALGVHSRLEAVAVSRRADLSSA